MLHESPRIVVVEDDTSMSIAIERILKAGGFTSTIFASAESALESNTASSADCLVLDVQLPGMSGLSLYRLLRETGAKGKAIFITAYDEPVIRIAAEKLGAKGFLSKPFSGRLLLEAIRQVLEIKPSVRNEGR